MSNANHAARTCERFVYSIVQFITRLFDYQTSQTHFWKKFPRCAKVNRLFFLDCPFLRLIGWTDKLRPHGDIAKQMHHTVV